MSVVAIDGPAGSGKSTVAAALAARLGVPHVDTGAYYRAAALAVLQAGADPSDAEGSARTIADATIERRNGRTWLDGADVEGEIRGPAVTAAVSAVSAHPPVRAALVELQRSEVGSGGAVVEGRDAATVVVPDADLKVWLTAAPQERARRRARQLGDEAALAAHIADLRRRDTADTRQMRRAPDVVEVDTTGLDVEEVVTALARRVAAVGQDA